MAVFMYAFLLVPTAAYPVGILNREGYEIYGIISGGVIMVAILTCALGTHHRIGSLAVEDQIVFVGVSSAHREAAFEAARYIMDYLKTEAPFWKKEITRSGEHWVEAREKDQTARARWSNPD